MKKKLFLGSALAAVLAVTSITTSGAGFTKPNTYKDGQFSDVTSDKWYAQSVASAYELGFMNGTDDTVFSPTGNVTVAQAITIAARVNDAYSSKGTSFDQSGTNWYDCYVDYAINNGIITDGQFDSYTRNITRAEMAVVFSKAVPADFLSAKNDITEIPDIPSTNAYFEDVLMLYKAGVVMGSDEFGTFKPNNNITRAEAAAIINRVALPESRLEGTLTDANYGDAYYLISDPGTLKEGQVNNESPWNYDNRGRYGIISNTANKVEDSSNEHKVELWRDVEDVTEGLIGWDFAGSISMCADGKYFKLCDDKLNEVASLTTKDGKFYFNGKDTGVTVKNGHLQFTIKVDLDINKALLYINSEKLGEFDAGDYTVSRVYIGSDKETTGTIVMSRCDVYKDYLINDIFLHTSNNSLMQWETTGETGIHKTAGQNYNDWYSGFLSGKSTAKKSFNKVSGDVVFEALMLFPTDGDTGYMSLTSAGEAVATLKINNDGIFKANGEKLRFHNNNIWQTLRIEADTVTGLVTYKVNGKVVAEGVSFDKYSETVDGVIFGSESGKVYFDDVKVYMTHDYDDYCPTPVPVTDDGYDVILNMCSLWREGYHSGWGAVSAFPDIEPALGYYDEGIVEVADWEIKFMVENGIDVQHLCWYCGQSDITVPMKKTNHNNALHDGFFNAKYSDMMKFTFMWENSGVNCKSLDQFKEFIWPYWMDYYFLDDRYYTIDNKLVFTVWSYAKFEEAFGSVANAKAAVEWMNEDAKANGFDGVLVFFADGHNTAANAFQKMADLGGSASYAYHWQQDGIYASKTIPRLQKNQDHKKIHIVPTVSVGFNNVGWSGERKDLASLEDHKKVLEYIKNDYLTKEEGWKAKTLIVSTWNEYGEGTYVMPTPGLHGFGYLENVAEVISGDTKHENNIYPTEQQKARLGHLYPESKTSMERLDYLKEEESESMIPAKVIASFEGEDFEIEMNTQSISYENGVAIGVSVHNDPAFRVKASEIPEGIDMSEVVAIRFEIAAIPAGTSTVYFTTQEDPKLSESKTFRIPLKESDEPQEYIVYTSENKNWTGTFGRFRLDIINSPGTYKVKKIELLGYSEEQLPPQLYVDNVKFDSHIPADFRNDEVYVTTDAYNGFFSLHNYYYEWSRKTGVLKIVSKNDTEVIFTVGSDKALVNGKEVQLKEKIALVDGIVEVPLKWLYDTTGISYTIEGTKIDAYSAEAKYVEILKNRKDGEWLFDVPGDAEGFTAADGTMTIADGCLNGEAIYREANKNYDVRYTVSNLVLPSNKYNKATIRMKANVEEDTGIALYFITTVETNWNQAKCITVPIKATDNGKFIEYTLDMGTLEGWTGDITALRIDPIGRGGTFSIDYIKLSHDPSIKKLNGLPYAENLKNADAEGSEVAFYGSNAAKISIVKDEQTGSNAYLVDAQQEKAWLYARQNVNWEAGATYELTADVKFTKRFDGDMQAKTNIIANVIYTDAEGNTNHIHHLGKFAPADGWQKVKATITIPEDAKEVDGGQFTFYTDPVGEFSMSYMFDNIVITKVS